MDEVHHGTIVVDGVEHQGSKRAAIQSGLGAVAVVSLVPSLVST